MIKKENSENESYNAIFEKKTTTEYKWQALENRTLTPFPHDFLDWITGYRAFYN